MTDDDVIPYEIPPDKRRRARRVHLKRKHKARDRYKPKSWMLWAWTRIVHWKHDHFERDYEFGRTKAPTDTGYGVAHEKRSSDDIWK